MSQYETDRENQAVGPELCEECNHPIRLHGPDGCEGERCVQIEASSEHMWGPCGCTGESNLEMDRRTSGSFGEAQQRLSRALDLLTNRVAGHLEAR